MTTRRALLIITGITLLVIAVGLLCIGSLAP